MAFTISASVVYAIVFALLLKAASPLNHENDYIKYPLHDGYVRSCSQKEESFGKEDTLEVRRYIPNIRSRDWSQDPLSFSEGDIHGTTSKYETRHYHQFDARSMEQIKSGEANIVDTYTETRGIETAFYRYPHLAGPYQTNLDEGTLNPYDDSAIAGWCGEDSAGDRVSFLMFDMADFDLRAIEKATLRMTAKQFPHKSKVEVRGACNISNPHVRGSVLSYRSPYGSTGGIRDGDFGDSVENIYGGDTTRDSITTWHEESLTWNTAPFIYDNEPDKVVCEWTSPEEDIYHDSNSPYECDITELAKAYANSYLCISLDMVHDESINNRDATVFFSREYSGDSQSPNFDATSTRMHDRESPGSDQLYNHQNLFYKSRHEREQLLEGDGYWRANAKTLKSTSDAAMGNTRTLGGDSMYSTGQGSDWFGPGSKSGTKFDSSNQFESILDMGLPGLEFGTVRRFNGGASPNSATSFKFGGGQTGQLYGSTRAGGGLYNGGRFDGGGGGRGAFNRDMRDAGATRRPHLLIEGSSCGNFPDYSSRDCN